jgi:hypothetical protein
MKKVSVFLFPLSVLTTNMKAQQTVIRISTDETDLILKTAASEMHSRVIELTLIEQK